MQVAAGGTSHDVFIWNIDINKRTCKMIHRLKAHESVIVAVAYYNFQGVSCVISASPDDMVRLWDVNTGVTIRMFSYGTFIPTSMAVQGDTLAVACWDNSLHLWAIGDTSTARPSRTIKGNERTIKAIAIDPSNVHVAVATGFLIKIWEISTGELYQELRGHRTLVTSLAFGLVRGTMALTTTSMDGEVRIWAYQPLHDPCSPNRGHTKDGKLGIIMVFYPQPIMEIALKDKGLPVELPDTLKSDRRVWMERLEQVTFLDLKKTAMEHIRSFIDIPIPQFGNVILEIVHSGIGLGYNESVGSCTNPKNGHAIKSAEVIFTAVSIAQ
jgi:WD40 repeat protein